jgi:hypothetical protein
MAAALVLSERTNTVMKNHDVFNQTMSPAANNSAVTMSDEREAWSMWDPAIPAEMYQQYLAA